MEKVLLSILAVIGVIAVVAGIGLIVAFPIKWCWNYTMPMLFDLHTITWGQAWLEFSGRMFDKGYTNK